jgi:hypothetical protein
MRRRTNLLLGAVVLAAAVVVLLRALDVLPEGVYDLITRAWPGLLVLFGLAVFLRDRTPYGGLIALLVTGVLLAGVGTFAFSSRATQDRSEYQETISQPIGAGVALLRLRVGTLTSRVELSQALQPGAVTGEFVGSTESRLIVDYTEAGDSTATLTVSEARPNPFPKLDAVGRGRLRLELPPGLALDVEFNGSDGDASLNLSGLAVERLNMDLARGSALVTLPAYRPLGSSASDNLGALLARDGSLTVFVPDSAAARLELIGVGLPDYDAAQYNLITDPQTGSRFLEARNFDTFDIKLRYVTNVPRGTLSLRVVESAGQP